MNNGNTRADDASSAPSIAEQDAKVIRGYFLDPDQRLLKAVRALFLSLSPTAEEKTLIKSTFADKELRAIMWKRFYPQMDRNTPIGTLSDIWMGAETMVFGQPKDVIQQAIEYKKRSLDMTKQALALLQDPNGTAPDLSYDPSALDPLGVNLLTRNQYVRHIEKQLGVLLLIANQKVATPAQVEVKKKKDGNK